MDLRTHDAKTVESPLVPHRVRLRTGVTLDYLSHGAPDGPVLLFVPGYTDSHHSFERTLAHIPYAYRSYVLTMRGHGNSSKPTSGYRQADFVEDIAAFMDALEIKCATLVGHSMGSFIAHQFAITHPQRLNGLVLIGSAPHPRNPAVLELNDYIQSLDQVAPEFVHEFQSSTFYHPLPESFLALVVGESCKVPVDVWKQALAEMIREDHSAQLGTIHIPTLIVAGAEDQYFVVAGQEALAQAIPHSHLLVYEETGHAPHVEQPQRFTADLHHFMLQRVLPTEARAAEHHHYAGSSWLKRLLLGNKELSGSMLSGD